MKKQYNPMESSLKMLSCKITKLNNLKCEVNDLATDILLEIQAKHPFIYKKDRAGHIRKYKTDYLRFNIGESSCLYIPVSNPYNNEARVVFISALFGKNWAFNKEDLK